uniref:Uncharacterized protein n=1 Tax=Cacopsylla melanoneura TaxID=428564 RepID=A0A8D8WS29_9HEMI
MHDTCWVFVMVMMPTSRILTIYILYPVYQKEVKSAKKAFDHIQSVKCRTLTKSSHPRSPILTISSLSNMLYFDQIQSSKKSHFDHVQSVKCRTLTKSCHPISPILTKSSLSNMLYFDQIQSSKKSHFDHKYPVCQICCTLTKSSHPRSPILTISIQSVKYVVL